MLKRIRVPGFGQLSYSSSYMPQTSKVDLGEITHSGFEVLNKDQKKRQENCTRTLIHSINRFN